MNNGWFPQLPVCFNLQYYYIYILSFLNRCNFHIFWYVNETYKTLLIPYCITLNLHTFSCCPHFITIIPIIMLLLSSPIMLSSLIIPLQHYNRSISIQKLWQIDKLSSIDLNSVIIPIFFFSIDHNTIFDAIWMHFDSFRFIWGSFGFIWVHLGIEKSDINWICIIEICVIFENISPHPTNHKYHTYHP